ncbi:MAG: ABC transporter ATP-binding protein [Proteobacteria bacterium]|nr:MAG: ABC transporter ATP-binding protein [Pseudomonadota bacterium]
MESHPLSAASLLRSLLFQRWRWRLAVLAISLVAAIFGILAPYSQKHFVDDLVVGNAATTWIWAAFFLTLGAQALFQISVWLASRESLISQKALADLAYGRILDGPGGLMGKGPAGAAVSLFAVDVPGAAAILDQAMVMASSMIFPIILAPLALHYFFGIPWWACGSVILSLGTFNFLLAKRQSRFFYNFKQLAAERTGLVSEWISNIRTLRILSWIEAAERRIFRLRRRETRNRKSMVTNGQVMNSVAGSATFALNILAVLLLLNLRGPNAEPTAGELLSLLWILGVFLAKPLRQLPWTFVISLDSLSSVRRLESALALPVIKPSVLTAGETTGTPCALQIKNLNLIIDGKSLLKAINLRLEAGALVAVVGEVGSGKSLLLQSLIGATGAQFEAYEVEGEAKAGPLDPAARAKIAFVPQEGFIMSASLRENVAFRYLPRDAIDEALDQRVLASLAAAEFRLDQERVNDGLDTEIGERGVNLSGGQRQRIGLARAHFADRSLILLDDPLSAVDVDTEQRLIDGLLNGAWKNRARLLATHRMAVLPLCDHVIFLENGQIAAEGTYAEILRRSAPFRDFVRREALPSLKPQTLNPEGVPHG